MPRLDVSTTSAASVQKNSGISMSAPQSWRMPSVPLKSSPHRPWPEMLPWGRGFYGAPSWLSTFAHRVHPRSTQKGRAGTWTTISST